MALWLLEAKAYPDDTRSPAAREARHWLQPGTYKIGRKAGEVDIVVQEDHSISRQHAVLSVQALQELPKGTAPYVLLEDCSRYGSAASPGNDLAGSDIKGVKCKLYHKWYLRFGAKSPFRLYLQDENLTYLVPPPCAMMLAQSRRAAKEALLSAAERGDIAAVRSLLSAGLSPNEARQERAWPRPACVGWTALHFAAAGGHLETVQVLLAAGADVSAGSDAGAGLQPLHAAAQHGHVRVMFALLLVGAGVDGWGTDRGPGPDGELQPTPLHLAVLERQWPAAHVLLAAGAAADAEAVKAAVVAGAGVGLLSALLEAGGRVAWEALCCAAQAGSLPAGKLQLLRAVTEAGGAGGAAAASREDGAQLHEGLQPAREEPGGRDEGVAANMASRATVAAAHETDLQCLSLDAGCNSSWGGTVHGGGIAAPRPTLPPA